MLLKETKLEREKVYLLIEKKRKEMLYLADKKGYVSRETIKCSQELDLLMNIYQKY